MGAHRPFDIVDFVGIYFHGSAYKEILVFPQHILLIVVNLLSVILTGKCSLDMEKALRASAFRHLHTLQLSYFS